jgi:DNA-binding NtrC family response regulator
MAFKEQLADVGVCGTVLIADDETMMREVMRIMITDNGGQALIAADGVDALKLFSENIDKINVAVIDYSMPRMDGYQALIEMRKLKPTLGVCVVSGLRQTAEVAQLAREGAIGFLSKPFSEDDFIAGVRSAFESSIKI